MTGYIKYDQILPSARQVWSKENERRKRDFHCIIAVNTYYSGAAPALIDFALSCLCSRWLHPFDGSLKKLKRKPGSGAQIAYRLGF